MFKKLLKYDLAYLFKIWKYIAIAVLGASVLSAFALGITIRLDMNETANAQYWITFVNIACMLLVSLFYILLMVLVGISAVIPIVRYYTNLCTDQAYLTYTLPVKRKHHVLSKILSSFIMDMSTLAVVLVAFLINFVVVTAMLGKFSQVFSNIGLLLSYLKGWTVAYAIEAILYYFVHSFTHISLVFLITQFCGSMKKSRKWVIPVVFFAIYFISGIIMSFFSYFLIFACVGVYNILSVMDVGQVHIFILVSILAEMALTALFGICFYFGLLDRVENKLNLS